MMNYFDVICNQFDGAYAQQVRKIPNYLNTAPGNYIIQECVKFINRKCASDTALKLLAEFLYNYTRCCHKLIVNPPKFSHVIANERNPVYYIEVDGKTRICTKNELAQGVRGIQCIYKYVHSESIYKYLNILAWLQTGKGIYYANAIGASLQKDDSIYTRICDASEVLKGALVFFKDKELNDIPPNLTKIVYPDHAPNEVHEPVDKKRLLISLEVKSEFLTKPQRQTVALAIHKPSMVKPENIAQLRDVYEIVRHKVTGDTLKAQKARQLSERVLIEHRIGTLPTGNIAVQVAKTLRQKKYINTTDKQLEALKDILTNLDMASSVSANVAQLHQGVSDGLIKLDSLLALVFKLVSENKFYEINQRKRQAIQERIAILANKEAEKNTVGILDFPSLSDAMNEALSSYNDVY